MTKPKYRISFASLALAVSIVSTSFTPVSSLAGSSALCFDLFGDEPAYKRVNATARMDARSYPMPNARSMHEYEISILPEGARFRDLLSRGDVVVDIGGGQGRAMSELAQSLPVHTVVINTQDFSGLHARTRFKGSFEFRAGWAEQKLKEIPDARVSLAVDLWGGFTYSPNKAEIIEEVYRTLKPGGRAYLLFSSKTPTLIEDPRVNFGQPVSLDVYLARAFKGLVSSRRAEHPDLKGAKVIEIVKPETGAPATIETGLVHTNVVRSRGDRGAFPDVTYSLKP